MPRPIHCKDRGLRGESTCCKGLPRTRAKQIWTFGRVDHLVGRHRMFFRIRSVKGRSDSIRLSPSSTQTPAQTVGRSMLFESTTQPARSHWDSKNFLITIRSQNLGTRLTVDTWSRWTGGHQLPINPPTTGCRFYAPTSRTKSQTSHTLSTCRASSGRSPRTASFSSRRLWRHCVPAKFSFMQRPPNK